MAVKTRLPNGARADAVPVHWVIERESKAIIDAAALQAGVSASVMVDHIARHLVLTEAGVPTTWSTPTPQDQLPITEGPQTMSG